MRVRFTAPARAELDAMYSYINERNPTAAQRVKSRIRHVAEQLGDIPYLGRSADGTGIRVRTVNPYPYLIFYTIRGEEVWILHIRHGARSPLSDLGA